MQLAKLQSTALAACQRLHISTCHSKAHWLTALSMAIILTIAMPGIAQCIQSTTLSADSIEYNYQARTLKT